MPTKEKFHKIFSSPLVLIIIFIVIFSSKSSSQTFEQFLNRINAAPQEQKSALIDSFLTAHKILPLIENDTTVYFIYFGQASTVTVPSDFNQWSTTASPLSRITGTNFWYLRKNFEPDARLDYKFLLNGTNWILDPRNPFTCAGGFGSNSELRMPKYKFPEEIDYRPDIPHGIIRDTTFYSKILGNSRKIKIYQSPGFSNGDSLALLIFHDGLEYISLAYANNVLDYLRFKGTIPPLIALFIPPVNRTPEYAGNQRDLFMTFITEEIYPWIINKYPIKRSSEWHATLGASNGGNISLWLGVSYPQIFGKIAAFSSNVQDGILDALRVKNLRELKIYIDIGTYDIPVLIPLVKNLRGFLEVNGYQYDFHEWHEGHSWGNWRAHIDDALEYLFSPASTKVNRDSKEGIKFKINVTPNPFNSEVRFMVSLFAEGRGDLKIYNLNGQLVKSFIFNSPDRGEIVFDWKPEPSLAAGIYLFSLEFRNNTSSGKILYLK